MLACDISDDSMYDGIPEVNPFPGSCKVYNDIILEVLVALSKITDGCGILDIICMLGTFGCDGYDVVMDYATFYCSINDT